MCVRIAKHGVPWRKQDGLREKIGDGLPPARVRSAPFVQIPLGVTEDRLVGTVDIEASMKVRILLQSQDVLRCSVILTWLSVICPARNCTQV